MDTETGVGSGPRTINSQQNQEKLETSSSTTEKNQSTHQEGLPLTEEREYLSGIKLLLVLALASLASFLVLLDMVIIAKV
jgi:hypothetical protein